MRTLLAVLSILFLLKSSYSICQSISGQSAPVNFSLKHKISGQSGEQHLNILKDTNVIFGLSAPTLIKVRQKESFSNISSSITFQIGNSKNELVNPKAVERNVSKNQQKESPIIELDKSLPKYYNLIIGINDYEFNNERLYKLKNPVPDAKKLQDVLTQSFSFQPEYSTILLNPTRQQIINAFENLGSKITEKDNLLIFYAGHGFWDDRLKIGYWLPSDARTDDKSSWISNSTIRDYIAGINSKHTLLIADACFSGSILRNRDINLTDIGMSSLYRLPSRKAMTSGTMTTVPDESKFMEFLIKRLNDIEGKYISARQLFYGLETAVINNTNSVPQFGVIQDTGDEGGDFIFIRK